MKLLTLILVAVCLPSLTEPANLKYCRKRSYTIDVVVAYGITPIANTFPFNLYKNGRTPNSVTEFTKVLLSIFDYLPTKIALVSFNHDLRQITGFNNNRNRLWSAFGRWEPRDGQPATSVAIQGIRDLFATSGRGNSRRLLIILTDRKSSNPKESGLQAAFARSEGTQVLTIGYGESYKDQGEIQAIAGQANHVFTVSNIYFLPRIIRDVKSRICSLLRVVSPTKPPPPVVTVPATVASLIGTTTPNPIIDEIVVLADDSESTRDFSGIDYFYNNDSIRFLDSVVTNVDYTQCRLAVYLFSRDTRTLAGNLTTNQSMLKDAVNNIEPSDNGFSSTNTADAISRAALTLTSSGIPTSNKYIVLLTDGQPDDMKEALEAARKARETGIKIGVLLSPLFDGQISYRLSDMSKLVDVQSGDAIRVLASRSDVADVISSTFCPVAGSIFDAPLQV